MMRNTIPFLALMALAVACDDGAGAATEFENDLGSIADSDGGSTGPDAGADAAEAPDAAPLDPERSIQGQFVTDSDGDDQSAWAAPAGDDDMPVSDVEVQLLGASGLVASTQTDADGTFVFPNLEDGRYVIAPTFPDAGCATRNCAPQFLRAVADGQVKVLTFGDSIPVIGDAPIFPERLKTLLSPITDVESVNVAIAGTTSPDWLPGTRNFRTRVLANLDDTDLVIISIGGNDILGYVQNPALLQDIPGAIDGATEVVHDVVDNVRTIVQAIREDHPDVDIAYCLYPDYSAATMNQLWGFAGRLLGREAIRGVLETARRVIPREERIVLVDLFGAADGLPLDDYLYDPLHFNDLGQSLYAETVFQTLGGVLIGDNPLGPTGTTPLGLTATYGVTLDASQD